MKRKIRALIVQAYPAVRAALRELLQEENDIVVLDECVDGDSAVIALRRYRPQLLFMGVQLPGRHGFDVLKALDGDAPPAIVFISMFDRYAARAFSVHAVDYLLHPVTPHRFKQAVARARHRLERQHDSASPASAAPARREPVKRITLRTEGRIVVLNTDEIEAVVAQRPSSVVYARAAAYPARFSLDEFRARLPAGKFLRINRSTVVNADHITDVMRGGHGDALLRLESGREFRLSRRFREEWASVLSRGTRRSRRAAAGAWGTTESGPD